MSLSEISKRVLKVVPKVGEVHEKHWQSMRSTAGVIRHHGLNYDNWLLNQVAQLRAEVALIKECVGIRRDWSDSDKNGALKQHRGKKNGKHK